jgi:hypothetical protein
MPRKIADEVIEVLDYVLGRFEVDPAPSRETVVPGLRHSSRGAGAR